MGIYITLWVKIRHNFMYLCCLNRSRFGHRELFLLAPSVYTFVIPLEMFLFVCFCLSFKHFFIFRPYKMLQVHLAYFLPQF